MDQFVNNQTSSAQKGGVQAGGVQERSVQKGSDQTGSGQAEKGIAESIARDRRPVTQIGSNIDYDRVTRAVRNLIVGVVALLAVLVGLSFFVEVQEVARARGEHGGTHVEQRPSEAMMDTIQARVAAARATTGPKYLAVRDAILGAITGGEWKPGMRLVFAAAASSRNLASIPPTPPNCSSRT